MTCLLGYDSKPPHHHYQPVTFDKTCRGLSKQQFTGNQETGVAGQQAEEPHGSKFIGVRAVPGVDGATVYAAFLGRPTSAIDASLPLKKHNSEQHESLSRVCCVFRRNGVSRSQVPFGR